VKPLYDDRDLAALIIARGYMTAAQVQEAERAASDPSPGRLATTLLSRKLVDAAVLEAVLTDLCKNQFRCRSCGVKFAALPRLEEKPVHCPSCGKWNLIPAASALTKGSGAPPAKAAGRATPTPKTGAVKAPALDATRPLEVEATKPLRGSEPPLAGPIGRALVASARDKVESGLENPLIPGNRFGRYEIVNEIARGAMGVVYRARHDDLKERVVALKVLLQEVADDYERIERFRREAQSLARIDHPNVVRVHDAGEADGHVYYTMELVEGETLEDLIKTAPLPPREAAAIMAQVTRGVAHLHSRGILHRDMKLTNVLIGADRRPRITDFGLARIVDRKTRLTIEGDRLGTPLYMSPEQVRGETALDERADIYGLGVMLFRLATRAYPLMAATPIELFAKVLAEPPTWPAGPVLDADFHTVIERALAKSPRDRHPDALAFAADLDALAEGKPIERPPLGARVRAALRRNRRLLQVAAVALLLSAVLAVGALAFRARSRGSQTEALARVARAKEGLKRVGDAIQAEFRSARGGSLVTIDASLGHASAEAVEAGRRGESVLGPVPAPGEPPDAGRISLENAIADLEVERWTVAALAARLRARALGATPWAAEALDRASAALGSVETPPAVALAAVPDERRRTADEDRAEVAEARADLSVLRGDLGTAVLSQRLALEVGTNADMRDDRTLALGIDQLLGGDVPGASATFDALERALRAGSKGMGEKAPVLDAALTFITLGRALAHEPEARATSLETLAAVGKPSQRWRATFVALVSLEKLRQRLADPGRADDAVLSLKTARADLRSGRKNQTLQDALFTRAVLGELELACDRPASAAEALAAALDPGDRADPVDRAKAFAVIARTPFAATLDDGLAVTGSLRAIGALRLAQARNRLLDDAVALEACEGSVAAAGSAGVVASRAHLELARAHRVAGAFDQAAVEDHRALEALGPTGAPSDPADARLARLAVAASRAKTLLARGLASGDSERERSLSGAEILVEDPAVSVEATVVAASIARLRRDDARARRLLEGVAPAMRNDRRIKAALGEGTDRVLEALVVTSQAESAASEAASASQRDNAAAAAPAEAPLGHASRALRAALLALDREPASAAALVALARARFVLARLGKGEAAVALAVARLAASAPGLERDGLGARALAVRALAAAPVATSQRELEASAKDLEDAILATSAAAPRLLERDDAIVAIRRRAGRAFDAGHAPALALDQARAVARLADEDRLFPRLRHVLDQDVVARARALGVDDVAAVRSLDQADRDNAEDDANLLLIQQAVFDAQLGNVNGFSALKPEIVAMIGHGLGVTVGDAHFYFARRAYHMIRSSVPLPPYQDASLVVELEPELFVRLLHRARVDKVIVEASRESLRLLAERSAEDLDQGDGTPTADPDILAALAYANAAWMDPERMDARPGIAVVRRFLWRRPEARIGHLLLGRFLHLAGDDAEAVRELELSMALPRPFHEYPQQVLGNVRVSEPESIAQYLLAEAEMALGNDARARDLLELAAKQKLMLPHWFAEQFATINPPPRGMESLFTLYPERK
jgi:tRNA A-37 threonylcarbamoyl transferase component Bud32